jgi:glucose-1-phosphate thymidylyltransferase
VQPSPDGLAQAYMLAEDFLDGAPSAMVLGDNIFFGHGLPELLAKADERGGGGTVFGYRVADPERYGVVAFGPTARCARSSRSRQGAAVELRGDRALFPRRHRARARPCGQALGARRAGDHLASGELPADGALDVQRMGRGYAWLDTGTHGSFWMREFRAHADRAAGHAERARPRKSPIRRAGSPPINWPRHRLRRVGNIETRQVRPRPTAP